MNQFQYLKWGLKKRWKQLTGAELYYSTEYRGNIRRFGTSYGGWWVCTDSLRGYAKDIQKSEGLPQFIVYDVGLGTDISFSLELLKHYDISVFGIDPTPRCRNWLKNIHLPQNFHFLPVGLSGKDSYLTMFEIEDESYASYSIARSSGGNTQQKSVQVEALSLGSIMDRLEHTRIDILKMDIEGSEYDVINDILSRKYEISQILVEVHHGIYPEYSIDQSRDLIESLRRNGWKIFKISPSLHEYHFIKQ